jgi:hypothetical protein
VLLASPAVDRVSGHGGGAQGPPGKRRRGLARRSTHEPEIVELLVGWVVARRNANHHERKLGCVVSSNHRHSPTPFVAMARTRAAASAMLSAWSVQLTGVPSTSLAALS